MTGCLYEIGSRVDPVLRGCVLPNLLIVKSIVEIKTLQIVLKLVVLENAINSFTTASQDEHLNF